MQSWPKSHWKSNSQSEVTQTLSTQIWPAGHSKSLKHISDPLHAPSMQT